MSDDEAVLLAAGYTVMWPPGHRTGTRIATIVKGGGEMQLEGATDSAFRFVPTQPDELFGYVLHPVDLAANKASAAADRRVPRDIVGLLTLHAAVLPLGATIAAAVGRFPGTTRVQPDPARLDRYRRHAGSVGGIWPSSADIERAMLDRPHPPATPS